MAKTDQGQTEADINEVDIPDWDSLVPAKTITNVDVDLLHFDVDNPRFTPDKKPDQSTDAAIISKLASTADLSELTQSIATSGYINIEPLIVVVRDGKLVVLEGNRRLAAIKSLRTPEYAHQAKLVVPEFGDDVMQTLSRVLVYRVEKEEDARELIGFKHINGPQAWDAYAKAAFAARWLDSQSAEAAPLKLVDIATRMGDNHATIHRMVTAFYVLQQAERTGTYSISDRQKKAFSFSHLYTGLSYAEFTLYLGMNRPDRSEDPSREPVPPSHLPKLRKLLLWLYGSKLDAVAPVIQSQNPDLGRLRDVLGSEAATRELEERGDLSAAVVTATPKQVRFSQHLVSANAELMKAQQTLDGFDPLSQSELQEIARSAAKRASVIRVSVEHAMLEYLSDINPTVTDDNSSDERAESEVAGQGRREH